MLHQFRLSMIQDRDTLEQHPELDVLVHVDGQGSQPDKQATWKALHVGAPEGIHWGWKNFYDEDTPMLTPQQHDGGRDADTVADHVPVAGCVGELSTAGGATHVSSVGADSMGSCLLLRRPSSRPPRSLRRRRRRCTP